MRRRVRYTYEAIKEEGLSYKGKEMTTERDKETETVARDIARAVKGIRYGYVQVIIQDSKIVQIDKTEKIRLDKPVTEREGGVEKVRA